MRSARHPRPVIGRWFAAGGGRREKTVLATKVYARVSGWPTGGQVVLNLLQPASGCR